MAKLARECGYPSLEFDHWRDFETLTDDADERRHCHKLLECGIRYAAKLGAKVLVFSTGDIKGEPLGRKMRIFAETFATFFRKIAICNR